MYNNEQAETYIRIAKRALVRARILRQHATIEQEFDALFADEPGDPPLAPELFEKALFCRRFAKIALQRALISNERLLETGNVFAEGVLKIALDGRYFRQWDEYKDMYHSDMTFMGVDPE